jgi:hypothetical protein
MAEQPSFSVDEISPEHVSGDLVLATRVTSFFESPRA